MPSLSPSLHLACQKPFWFAESHQTRLEDVDGMQARQGVDECFADDLRTVQQSCQFSRKRVAQDDSVTSLHKEKNGTQDPEVLAQKKDSGCRRKVGMHHLQETKFPGHVVSFCGHRAERSAPEHVFTPDLICSQQIRQVGVAAGELFNSYATFNTLDSSSKVIRERVDIEFFAGTNRSGLTGQWKCPRLQVEQL